MESAKASSDVRKVKKKQVKDEMDRVKQAEKKKRRLEKALATSAAIRCELEKKKKQKKIEEQKRLDEEGAAIAEAVALQVLLGEDSDNDSCSIMIKKDDEEYNPWNCCANLFMEGGKRRQSVVPCYSLSGSPTEVNGWVNAHQSGQSYNFHGTYFNEGGCWESTEIIGDFHGPYINEGGGWEAEEISAGLVAAQAVSALQIAEDEHVDAFVFKNMVRG